MMHVLWVLALALSMMLVHAATVPLNFALYSALSCPANAVTQSTGGATTCTMCTNALVNGYTVPALLGTSSSLTADCTLDDVLTPAKESYIRTLLNDAKAFITSSLSLPSTTTSLSTTIQSTCSGSSTLALSAPFSTSSVDATSTIHIVWTAVPLSDTNADPRALLWSLNCQVDATSGRPFVVHLNFVPSALFNADANNALAYRNDLDAVIHELVHAMGFRSNVFAKRGVWSLSGQWDTSAKTIFSSYSTSMSSYITYVGTPRVLQAVRAFTGCGTDLGAQIEDVTSITVDTKLHWKMRVFPQDVMTSQRSTTMRFHSNLTLSFLEDTGLYVRVPSVSPWTASMAQITFGAGWGCSFLSTLCSYNASRGGTTTGYTFSTPDAFAEGCTYDRLARGYSDASTLTSVTIPALFRYYGSTLNQGGSFAENDYCPVVVPFDNGACIDSANRDGLNIIGSTYGPTSRCFFANVASQGFTDSSITRCFQVVCDQSGLSFKLQGYAPLIACPSGGGDVTVPSDSGFSGVVRCPPVGVMCNNFAASINVTSEIPLPVWSYQGQDISQTVGVNSPFIAAETCSTRFESCFVPALDSLWGQGECGPIAVAFERCFGGDCIQTRNSLLRQKFLSSNGRTIAMFAQNCSDSFFATRCVDGPDGHYSYCNLASRPSSASTASGTLALAAAALMFLLS